MATIPFCEYDVRQLISARKFVSKILQDNTQTKIGAEYEKHIVYEIRRVDTPTKDIRLRLCARIPPSVPGVGVKPTPGVALQWHGKIIRKLDSVMRHTSIQNDIPIGDVHGWHEHIWTDEDEGRYVVAANPPVKNADMKALIRWAAKKWNVELEKQDERLF